MKIGEVEDRRGGSSALPLGITLPEVAKKKRATGIVGLNLLLDGGFPEGAVIMVYGTAITGVDLAAMQFYKAGPEEEGTYLKVDDIINHEKDDTSGIRPEIFLMQLAGTRIVVDSFTGVIERYGSNDALRLVRLLKEDVQKTGADVMFIVFSGVHTPMEMTKLMRESDVVIEFRLETSQAELQRTLAVQKIRDAMAPSRLLPFIITEKGIEASTTSRVV